jgi:heptosyltransferase III
MRILVLRGGALGDLLVTIPALRALRTRWPGADVVLVGNRRAAELAVIDGCVQAVHDQHAARWAALFDAEPLPGELRRWLESFDLVVNYWPDPDGTLAHHFIDWGERFVAGSAAVAERPAARHFLGPLGRLGCTSGELAPIIAFPESVRTEACNALDGAREVVAMHAGSGSPKKTWPLDRWHAIARRVRRPILWITGEADGELAPPPDVDVVHARGWSLPQLGAALAQCVYYLGHDTGVSHLAAAAGASGVLLFGPTDPETWAPPTPRMRVLRAGNGRIESITVEEVLAAKPV